MEKYLRKKKLFFALGPIFLIMIGAGAWNLKMGSDFIYVAGGDARFAGEEMGISERQNIEKIPLPVAHLKTPEPVKGIYMTSCVAATPSLRKNLVKLADETEINAIVIDIKDYSGRISFKTGNALLQEAVDGCVAEDMKEFVQELHDKNIYAIGRITVFQDPFYSKKRPDLAVKKSDKKTVWKDKKGLSFIDVGAKEYWDYIVALSKESYEIGFDELNFDYVRFPSDGNMKDIYFTFSNDMLVKNPLGKAEVLREFFAYLNEQLKDAGIVLSVDLFGMVTTNKDDLGIGQILEYAAPYFSYISPMVYPSHYPPTYDGFKNPAAHPYEVIYHAMASSTERMIIASSTPDKIRPWLQDFNLGADYTADMVRKEKQAVYDAGLTSWLLWDPNNRYTREALDKE